MTGFDWSPTKMAQGQLKFCFALTSRAHKNGQLK